MTTAWAHLPNAKHIDRVLADLAEHPERWVAARSRDSATGDAWTEAWSAAWDAARDASRGASWSAAWEAVRDAASGVAWDAAVALIAWDHAGELLDLPPDELEAIAKLGVPAAVLLLPASRALNGGST